VPLTVCDSDLVSPYYPSKYKNTFDVSFCLPPTVQTTKKECLIFRINLIWPIKWVGHILRAGKKRTVRRVTQRRPIAVRRRIGRWRLSCEGDVKEDLGK
jgi:16S rRNA U516 pseudouridylate synthase RsuA-like enzyme